MQGCEVQLAKVMFLREESERNILCLTRHTRQQEVTYLLGLVHQSSKCQTQMKQQLNVRWFSTDASQSNSMIYDVEVFPCQVKADSDFHAYVVVAELNLINVYALPKAQLAWMKMKPVASYGVGLRLCFTKLSLDFEASSVRLSVKMAAAAFTLIDGGTVDETSENGCLGGKVGAQNRVTLCIWQSTGSSKLDLVRVIDTGHKKQIMDIKWCNIDEHEGYIMTASMDGSMKVWRAPKPTAIGQDAASSGGAAVIKGKFSLSSLANNTAAHFSRLTLHQQN